MKIHEYQGKEILAQVRRAGTARLPGFHRAGGHRSGAEAGRLGLGGEGADPRRRARQGRRRQAGALAGRSQAARRADPGHAAEDPPDRTRRAESAPPAHRRRRRHPARVLRGRAHRPGDTERGPDGQQRRRHGHRGRGARHAGEDHQGLRRPVDRADRRAGAATGRRHRHPRRQPAAGGRRCFSACTPATWIPMPAWPRSTR